MSLQSDYSSGSGGALGVGGIIANAFVGVNKNFLTLFLLMIPFYIAYVAVFGSVLFTSVALLTSGNFRDPNAMAAMNMGGGMALFILGELAIMIVWVICACAMIRVLHTRYNSMPESLLSSIQWGVGRILPLIGIFLICVLAYVAFALATILIVGVLSFVFGRLASLLVILAYGYAIYLAFPYILAGIVCVVEKAGPIVSLKRSKQLVRSYSWPMLGLIVASFVILFVIEMIVIFVLGFVLRALPFGGILVFIAGAFLVPYINAWILAIYTIAYNRLNLLKGGLSSGPAIANVFE